MKLSKTDGVKIIALIGVILAVWYFYRLLNGEAHFSKVAHAKECMRLLQECADQFQRESGKGLYPGKHEELEAYCSFRKGRLKDALAQGDFIFDVPHSTVNELLVGNTGSLESLRNAGKIGYGTTSDGKRFVIIGFDSAELNARPLTGAKATTLILSDHGTVIEPR